MYKSTHEKISQTERLIGELEKRIGMDLPAEAYKVNAQRMSGLYKYKERLESYKADEEKKRVYERRTYERDDDDDGVESRVRNGEVEYHTSYGWFTDEQIKNLQGSRYFND